MESYMMPFILREEYIKLFNEYQEEKSKVFDENNS